MSLWLYSLSIHSFICLNYTFVIIKFLSFNKLYLEIWLYFMVTHISSWTSIIMLGFERRWMTIHIILFGKLWECTYYVQSIEKKQDNLHTSSRQNLLYNLKNITYILSQKRDQSISKEYPLAGSLFLPFFP